MPTWKRADQENPKHKKDMWSDEMICITNLGNVYKLTYMGVWQRMRSFLPGEIVEWWIEKPDAEQDYQSDRLCTDAIHVGPFLNTPDGNAKCDACGEEW